MNIEQSAQRWFRDRLRTSLIRFREMRNNQGRQTMTIRRTALTAAAAIVVCAAVPATSFGYSGNSEPSISRLDFQHQAIGTSLLRFGTDGKVAIKWTPLPGKWVACTVNGMKCKCKGDVADCRAATPPKKIQTMTVSGRLRSQAEKRLEQQRKDLTRNWAG